MIDTEKYEGRTPAPWRIVKPSPGEAHHIWRIESETEIDEILDYNTWVAHICVIQNEPDDTINAELIADAPLIRQALIDEREEVKRLRKQLDSLREFCYKEDYDIYNWEVRNIEVIE